MNVRDFEYLIALEQYRHFGRAAEACFVSQPTLSGQIKKLEEHLNVQLVERTSRSVVFTSHGLALVEQARTIIGQVKCFQQLARQSNGLKGTFHLGVIPTIAPYILPLIIAPITEQFPDLKLFIREDHTDVLIEKMNKGELDCLLLAEVDATQELHTFCLVDEPLLLAVSNKHAWADACSKPVGELAGQSVMVLEDGHCLKDHVLNYCFAAGANNDERFKASSLETLRHMVSANVGITLLPAAAVHKESNTNLVCIPFEPPQPSRRLVLAIRPTSDKNVVEPLANLMKNTLDQYPYFNSLN